MTRTPLAAIRIRAGFKGAPAAAAAIGCTKQHVYNIERGRVGASNPLLLRMEQAYGVPIATLRRAIRSGQRALLIRKLASHKH